MRLLVNGILLVLSFTTQNTRAQELVDGTCYEDDGSRLLDEQHDSSTNTPDECKMICAGLGYLYAGVQSKNQCFCGNEEPPASRIRPSEECYKDCPGDASQKCGASWRMNIYNTGLEIPIPYLGYNINVADKCCFIIRSPGHDTFILTNAFNENCSGGCAYTRYDNLYVESTELETCLEDIPSPSCCSYDTGALCTQYGENNENNIKLSGTCSEHCKEIADCSLETSNDWCLSNQIRSDSETSPHIEKRSADSLKGVDGKWTLIFRQTLPYLYKKNEFTKEENNPNAANFARLEDLENFRGSDQRFTLKLRWPGLNKENIWSQTSNPVTKKTRGVYNYKAIKIASTGYQWGGLEYNNAQALLDGSVNHGNWWYAVGSISSFSGGIPGPCIVEQKVELWVKTSEFSPAFLLSSDASRLLIDIGENAFNAVFKKCPVVRGLRSVYVRISPLPDSFNAFNIFTGTWSSTNNLINEDFKLYNNIEDATNDVNAWTYCNYNDPGVGFPRDCGQNGVIGNCQFFSMPGNNYEGCIAKNNFKNNGLQIIDGSDCPFTTTTLSDRPVPVKQTAQEYPFALTPPEESGRKKRSAFSRCNGCWNAWIYTCYNAYSYCVYHKQTNWYKLPQMSKWFQFKHECCYTMQNTCSINGWKYTCPAS